MALTKAKASNILLTTPAASSNDVTPATTQYVTTAINNLIDGAPATLNTLDEIAAALNDDAALNTTLTNAIATKLPLAGGTLTGNLTGKAVTLAPDTAGKLTIRLTTNAANDGRIVIRSDTTDKVDIQANGASYFNGGNVGIGTDNPSTKLTVRNDSAVTSFGDNNIITLQNANTTDNSRIGLAFTGNTGVGSGLAVIDAVSYDQSAGHTSLNFSVYNGAWHSDMMVLKAGNVGIGTNNPSATDWGSASKVLQISGTQPLLSLKDTDAGGEFQIANSNQNLYFYDTAGSGEKTRIFIKADGNVGIGTTSPFGITTNRTCLSVNGTSSVSLNIGVGNAQKGYLYTDGNVTQLGSVGNIPLKFAPNDSPKLELSTSGELSMYGNKMVIDSDYSQWSGKYQHLTCHNTITSNQTWTDVAYVSYSPSLTIQGSAQRDNNGGLGMSNFLGTIFGGYGATSVATTRSQANPMNGGNFGALEYRYLNSGASSGSYRLQVRLPIGSGTMYVTTTLTGHAWQEIYED